MRTDDPNTDANEAGPEECEIGQTEERDCADAYICTNTSDRAYNARPCRLPVVGTDDPTVAEQCGTAGTCGVTAGTKKVSCIEDLEQQACVFETAGQSLSPCQPKR